MFRHAGQRIGGRVDVVSEQAPSMRHGRGDPVFERRCCRGDVTSWHVFILPVRALRTRTAPESRGRDRPAVAGYTSTGRSSSVIQCDQEPM
ncbi:hypothetical protein GCM10027572_28240 [Flexivirga lutea]